MTKENLIKLYKHFKEVNHKQGLENIRSKHPKICEEVDNEKEVKEEETDSKTKKRGK